MISKLPVLFLLVTAVGRSSTVEEQVRAVLDKQVVAWNKGDTDGFLDGYASDTIFVGEKMTRGLEDLKRRYQARYPTREAMGKLSPVLRSGDSRDGQGFCVRQSAGGNWSATKKAAAT